MMMYWYCILNSENKCYICSKISTFDYKVSLSEILKMGNRFTQCFSTIQYNTVEAYSRKKRGRKYSDSSTPTIALELDFAESQNPGLILREHYDV